MDINWDDEDLPGPRVPSDDGSDDLFEFESTLKIEDDDAPPAEDLPPLPEGAADVFGDRGVIIQKRNRPSANVDGDGDGGGSGSGGSSSPGSSAPAPAPVFPSAANPHVELHYEGFLASTGEKFDSSHAQGYPMIAHLDLPPKGESVLIRGWEAALPRLRAGDVATLSIAARYAYGEEGYAPLEIPPNADLRFEIEVLDVRATHRPVEIVDNSKTDLSRLEEIRREREVAQMRREEEDKHKKKEKEVKVDRAAMLREKLASKQKNQGKKGKKGKKKK